MPVPSFSGLCALSELLLFSTSALVLSGVLPGPNLKRRTGLQCRLQWCRLQWGRVSRQAFRFRLLHHQTVHRLECVHRFLADER